MNYHYQTQPNPNPLSPVFNKAPEAWHMVETFGNHVIELAAPLLLLLPFNRNVVAVGGAIQIAFQAVLISSGNLSFLNWLTMLPAIMCFDDGHMRAVFPRASLLRAEEAHRLSGTPPKTFSARLQHIFRALCFLCLTTLVVYKSMPVIANMLSIDQSMNRAFDTWKIVNTYGAFGSITRRRVEVVLEGANELVDAPSDGPGGISGGGGIGGTEWRQYEFKCKPGDINRPPCLISPYHYRLDWQMWFAGFQTLEANPWILHLMHGLLVQDPRAESLIAHDPFEGGPPPRYVRAVKYLYEFTSTPTERSVFGTRVAYDEEGTWWRRRFLHEFVPPFTVENQKIANFLRSTGYLRGGD